MTDKVCTFDDKETYKLEEGAVIINQICGSGATAVLQIQGHTMQSSVNIPIPVKYYHFEYTEEIYSPWDTMIFSPYYTGRSKEVEIFEQYQILRNFSLKLLENTKEIDPEIANIVNQNFTKLL